MLCVPPANAAVEQEAVRPFPLPNSETAEHPASDVPPSVKLTLPVGLVPVTVAVNVTLDPALEGLAELASVVFVAPPPPLVTLTVRALEVAPVTIMFTPYVLSR
jgi:hypothetical protein